MAIQDVQDQAISFLQKSIVPILVVVVLCIAGGVGYQFYKKSHLQKLEKASDELFVIQKDLSQEMLKLNPEEPQNPLDKTPVKAPKAKPTVEQMSAAYGPVVARLQTFIKANEGTQPAVEAALIVSEVATEYQKEDEGITALQNASKGFDKKNFLFGVAQSELGSLLAKKDKCAEASQAWDSVIDVQEHSYMADELRLKSGVCYQKLGQFEKAEKLFEDVIKNNAKTSSGRMAKKFLLYIKYVKSKAANDKTQEQKNG